MLNNFGREQGVGTVIPAFGFTGRAQGNAEEVISVSAVTSSMAFLNIGGDGARALDDLLNYGTPAGVLL